MEQRTPREQVDALVTEWAEEAWKRGNGEWDQAQEAFVKIKDEEFPGLDPAVAQEFGSLVWRLFADQTINSIVRHFRKTTVTPKPKPTTPGAGEPNSVHTVGGALQIAAERMAIEDSYYLPTCKKRLGDATEGDLARESAKYGKYVSSYGKSKKLIDSTRDKMFEAGVKKGSQTKSREVVHTDYFARLKEQIYG